MTNVLAPLAITDGQTWAKALLIVGIAAAAYVLILWVSLLVWTYRDAGSRTKQTGLQAGAVLLVAVFNLPGLLLYLALRPPEALVDTYGRELEAAAFLREIQKPDACADCGRSVAANFVACPFCRAALQTPCTNCEQMLRTSYTICPYCTAPRETEQWPVRARRVAAAPAREMPGTAAAPDVEAQPARRQAPVQQGA